MNTLRKSRGKVVPEVSFSPGFLSQLRQKPFRVSSLPTCPLTLLPILIFLAGREEAKGNFEGVTGAQA